MRFFFKSKRFKIILAIVLILSLIGGVTGVVLVTAPQSDILGAIIRPVQSAADSVAGAVGGFFDQMQENQAVLDENEQLKEQAAQDRYKLADYEELQRQNEFYKEFLGIKEDHPSFSFEPAMVIARDTAQPFGTFTINKGSLAGVEQYDPVITSAGIVGYVGQVSATQSVVKTVLHPDINISVLDNRTRDSGNLTGDAALAQDGTCKMIYLPRDNAVAAGDLIVSSGEGGVFPAGLIVGTVTEIKASGNDTGYYAVIRPAEQPEEVDDVMVLTDFEGQSHLAE